MAQPWRHPKTGVYYYRARLPADLAPKLKGRTLVLTVAGAPGTIKAGAAIKVSLQTKDVAEARLRHASLQAQIERRWASARQQPVTLSHRQIMEIAGEWYADLVQSHEDNPGRAESWSIYQDLLFEGTDFLDDGSEDSSNPVQAERILARHIPIDAWLEEHGYNLDRKTRGKVLVEVASALLKAAETLQRRAGGDYSPDHVAQTFPKQSQRIAARTSQNDRRTSLSDAFEGWAKEAQPAAKTVIEWRKHVESFVAFVGTDELAAITRNSVIGWKDHLLDQGNAPKTINGTKLAALRVVLKWALDNGRVETNVAEGVSVRRSAKAGQRMRHFDLHQAAAILHAASKEASPSYRWVPLLCAQAGARVAEICQLRVEDIREEAGIWFMDIRADAGSVKTEASERKVPLHPHVLDAGFLDFVKSKHSGPLFFDPSRRKALAQRPQSKIVAKNVAAWVHRLGLEVGRPYRKDPNHAWRHLFRTLALERGIQSRVLDAIQGYAPRSVADGYGEVTLRVKADAIRKVPLPGVWEPLAKDEG